MSEYDNGYHDGYSSGHPHSNDLGYRNRYSSGQMDLDNDNRRISESRGSGSHYSAGDDITIPQIIIDLIITVAIIGSIGADAENVNGFLLLLLLIGIWIGVMFLHSMIKILIHR